MDYGTMSPADFAAVMGNGNRGNGGHSKKDRMIDHIEQLMDVAQNEQERQFLVKWLDRIQNS